MVYKANKLGESMFARQSERLMLSEEELGSQSPVSYEEDFEDLSGNADLYVFNDQMVQGYIEELILILIPEIMRNP